MKDYIRKAVELVGWLDEDDEGEYLQIPQAPTSAYLDEILAPCEQYLLDALAAQLVRQVDALRTSDHELEFWQRKGIAWIENHGDVPISREDGPDRTMNTIKAIVDSGVLSD